MNDKRVTTGEIQAHLAEIYGVQVSRDTISTITDRVLDSLAEWQSHPLDSVRAVTFIYVINVKIRDGTVANRPIYVEQAVRADGERDVLGLWRGARRRGLPRGQEVATKIKLHRQVDNTPGSGPAERPCGLRCRRHVRASPNTVYLRAEAVLP
jgi:putative transposase